MIRLFANLSFPERVIAYLCLSAVVTKVVFELGLGLWWYRLSTTTLMMFLCFLAVDHAIWLARGKFHGITRDKPMLALMLLWLTMTLHGIIVGALQGQPVLRILDDTVPPLMCLVTLVRFSLLPPIDYSAAFRRLAALIPIAAVICVIAGLIAVALGLPSRPSPGTHVFALLIGVVCVGIAKDRITVRGIWGLAAFAAVFFASIADISRSTLAAMGLLILLALIMRLRRNPIGALGGLIVAGAFPFLLLAIVPEDSKTAVRLSALFDVSAAQDSISLNSRVLEEQQVRDALARGGVTTQALGLGHGATYEFVAYGRTSLDHAHAHYATAYMQLRYGLVGYVYVGAIALSLLMGLWVGLRNGSRMALLLAALNVTCFIYLFTWVNFFFYFMGFTYLIFVRDLRRWRDDGATERLPQTRKATV